MEQGLDFFLKEGAVAQFKTLSANTSNVFGKMNVLQMLEHVAEWISISSGKIKFELQTPAQDLPKWKAFLLSDKEMRANTPNSLMSEVPKPAKFSDVELAANAVQQELNAYFNRFKGKEFETETHPFFGPLNYDEWAVLHGKHLRHHLRQFGVNV
jgi:hypothetical protein